MIENRSRRWSFQFIILPLLRDDSSALKLLSTIRVEGGAEKSGVMPAELREPGEGWGEKLLFSESPPASLTPSHTRPLRPRSWTNFVAGGKGLRQALEKFLQFFDNALHLLNPFVFSGSSVPRSRGELTTRRASYELTPVAFVPVPRIRKTRATIYIRRTDVCLRCTSSGTNEKYAPVLPLLLSFLRERLHFR